MSHCSWLRERLTRFDRLSPRYDILSIWFWSVSYPVRILFLNWMGDRRPKSINNSSVPVLTMGIKFTLSVGIITSNSRFLYINSISCETVQGKHLMSRSGSGPDVSLYEYLTSNVPHTLELRHHSHPCEKTLASYLYHGAGYDSSNIMLLS